MPTKKPRTEYFRTYDAKRRPHLSVRMTIEQRDHVRQAAQAAGLSTSEWVMETILERLSGG